MDKLKSVLSHGQGKNEHATQGHNDTPAAAESDRSKTGGLTGEGSHLAGTHQSAQGSSGEYHPIYDQFAKGDAPGTAGEPIKTTDHAPHFSTTPNLSQPSSSNVAGSSVPPSATASLRPDTAHKSAPQDDTSTASIKSGVIGFPQEPHDLHPTLARNNAFEQSQQAQDQAVASDDFAAGSTGEHSSHLERDAATGAGVLGAGTLASRGLQGQSEDTSYNTSAGTDEGIRGRSAQESDIPESGRSFPLAGGVTNQRPTEKTTVSEREPGTKEKEVGVHDGQGREALAGAAAAAAASSLSPQSEQQTGVHHQSQTSQTANPEALAAAKAATSSAPDEHGWTHDHGGHGHTFSGDPCETGNKQSSSGQEGSGLLFTSGPHSTDTANRVDPKLHIPGEFPSPTPLEESNAPSYLQSKPTTETSPSAFAEPELRHTGSLNEPKARSAEQSQQSTSEHHHGRDAAIAGGLGAAGVGAYEAGKHHQKQSTDIGEETFPAEPNPYTSTKVDPRVDTTPRGFHEQRFDPTASEKHTGRNVALTGGVIGASDPSTREAPQARELQNKEYPAPGQDDKAQHHYGRDAALVGAGAATTAGLYASQRDAEPDSGPASSTIGPHKSNVANVVDPRVQPNPDLQKHHYAAPTAEDPAPSTVGPHKSDVANIVDPRVLPDPQKQKAAPASTREGDSKASDKLDTNLTEDPRKEQYNYGRDAAVAGGAGATGYGAYEAAKSYGEHRNTQPGASMSDQRYDPTAPRAHDPTTTSTQHDLKTQDQHHYGRDAAVAGGLGAAGAGVYAATRGHGQDQQATTSQGLPVHEQRYDPSASTQRHDPSAFTQQDRTSEDQHHYGRDAAAVGGLGAAGAGAYAAHRGHGQDQQSTASQAHPVSEQRHDPSLSTQQDSTSQDQHHIGRDAAAVGGLGAAGAGAYAATRGHNQNQHSTDPLNYSANQQSYDPSTSTQQGGATQDKHHYGRDAAVVGGVGAAGAGAYAATRGHDQAQPPPATQGYQQSSAAPGYQQSSGAQAYQQPSAAQAFQQPETGSHQRYDSTQDPNNDHQKRNAALGTAAAAGVGAGGAYAYSQHDAQKEQERQLKEQQKVYQDQQKELEKKQAKDQKHHDKLVAAEEKKHQKDAEHKEREQQKELEKQHAKEQKHHDKLVAAEEKKHQKDVEHKEREQQKELEKQHAIEQKQHDKLVAAEQQQQSKEAERPAEEEGSPKEKKHRLFGFLHRDKKDKDKTSEENSPRQSRDSPRHSKEYAAGAGAAGLAGAAAYEGTHDDGKHLGEKKGRNVLHKDPPKGHPAREAMEQGGKREHVGIDGPIGDPNLVSGDHQTSSGVYGAHPPEGQHHTVTEPYTGLPANVERYGDGAGGTDGSNTIHSHLQEGGGAGHQGTNWEQTRKADTPY
ncbi:hypothetical protein N0V90_011873 [Kalmusia sp. IMI 367209]|nr:hypothetical protein N0V90_011873 [Kalmusia sp. IMI 367209]